MSPGGVPAVLSQNFLTKVVVPVGKVKWKTVMEKLEVKDVEFKEN